MENYSLHREAIAQELISLGSDTYPAQVMCLASRSVNLFN